MQGINDLAEKLGITIVMALVAFIPTWLYLIARWALEPEGFWQNLILAGFGLYCLGLTQFIFGIVLLAMLFAVWNN